MLEASLIQSQIKVTQGYRETLSWKQQNYKQNKTKQKQQQKDSTLARGMVADTFNSNTQDQRPSWSG